MTVMTRPDDTGGIPVAPGDRTQKISVPGTLDETAPRPDDGPTLRISPETTAALTFPHGTRRPAADDTGEILYRADVDVPATVADVDLLAGPQKPVPAPKPAKALDQGDAQPVGPLDRVAAAQIRYIPDAPPTWWDRWTYKARHRAAMDKEGGDAR